VAFVIRSGARSMRYPSRCWYRARDCCVRTENIGEIAFAIRQTDTYRARKALRRNAGETIDDIIIGTGRSLNWL
jgi:hypothetical protein